MLCLEIESFSLVISSGIVINYIFKCKMVSYSISRVNNIGFNKTILMFMFNVTESQGKSRYIVTIKLLLENARYKFC